MTSPELRALRQSQDRNYASEGIPMLLALVSEVEPIPDPESAEGAELAAAVQRYAGSLAAGFRDGDLGMVVSVLQAVAYTDFDAGQSQ